jgi:CDP-glucose 4,6-dehydratase
METLVSSLALMRGRTVLVTGHTGFKGSWLAHWLISAGADVHGIALPPHTTRSLFDDLRLANRMNSVFCDIRHADELHSHINTIKPEIVLHLAAQAIVKKSYSDPIGTFTTNVVGSLNMLEAVRNCESVKSFVFVTSDKCYLNRELTRGYHEEDELGGADPYSASKASAELLYHSYVPSFFVSKPHLAVASARAGNVVGGGDWSDDRLVPDCVRALMTDHPIVLRRPEATRPWQHVLEPLSGYVTLAGNLLSRTVASGESWNFGPHEHDVHTVHDVATRCVSVWGNGSIVVDTSQQSMHEATLLQLNCQKAASRLNWQPRWKYETTIDRTIRWYRGLHDGVSAEELVDTDINDYVAAT